MPRKGQDVFGFWMSAFEAQAAMWTTLSVRVPQLMAGTMTPAEQDRMVSEKFEALAESAQGMSRSLGRLMLEPVRTPMAMLDAMASFSAAASRPYHRRIAANAKRLRKIRTRSPD